MKPSDKKLERITHIAKMYYNENKTQQEIAKEVNLSRPMVSVLLNEARSLGVVSITVNDVASAIQLLEKRIEEQFSLKKAVVVKNGRSALETDDEIARTAYNVCFSEGGAKRLIGVGWGSMVGKLTDYAESLDISLGMDGKIFPLIGGIGASYRSYHTNEIVRVLSSHTGLAAEYCYLPAFFDSQEEREYAERLENYRAYKDNCSSMDMAIINISNYPSYPDLGVVYRYEDLLSKHKAAGRLLAHYYDEDGQIITPKVDNVMQASIDELRGTKNVTALCSSHLQSTSVAGALRIGVITNIVIPESLASKLVLNM
ncbi:MAG: sugar-binding domain-containing protein [Oscillospiraceae bacterium]